MACALIPGPRCDVFVLQLLIPKLSFSCGGVLSREVLDDLLKSQTVDSAMRQASMQGTSHRVISPRNRANSKMVAKNNSDNLQRRPLSFGGRTEWRPQGGQTTRAASSPFIQFSSTGLMGSFWAIWVSKASNLDVDDSQRLLSIVLLISSASLARSAKPNTLVSRDENLSTSHKELISYVGNSGFKR